jgi:hypothetical protein
MLYKSRLHNYDWCCFNSLTYCFIIIFDLLSLLYRIFLIIYLTQIMFLTSITLKLFCGYNTWYR